MIDDKRLRDVKKWLEKCDSPYEMEYAYYALEALEELQTLREQKGKYIESQVKEWGITAQKYEDRISELEEQNKEWEKSVKKREEYITKLEWQKNNLIEDSEYWFSLADKYAIRNIPAVIERAKQHNALMQESEKIIK